MGRLHTKAVQCNHKEHDRWLKEQSSNGKNEEIIKELMTQKNMSEMDSEQVLMWAKQLEAQGV